MVKTRAWITAAAACVALLSAAPPARAQTRGSITGQVVDASTGTPLPGAQVLVAGTTLGTLTNSQGRYTVANVPPGTYTVTANMLNFAAGSSRVSLSAGGTATADFRLAPSAVALSELVVTGTAGTVQRRQSPAVVATVDASQAVEKGMVNNVADLLAARVPGVQLTQSSGTSGTAQQIRIRGASSISLSNEPLVFIDGVRADARTENIINVGGQGISRLFDINPDDIERIEVVKGPAAATLYGADASAGVIQIITKKGRTGQNRFQQSVSYEYNEIDPNFTPLANYGICSSGQVAAGSGRALCEGQAPGAVVSDNPLLRTGAFRNGRLNSVDYSGRGGGENYGYFVSLGYAREDGTLPNNYFDRRSARVNFNFTPTSKLALSAKVGLLNTTNNLPVNDNNIYGFLGGGYLGRPTNVLRDSTGTMIGGFYAPNRELAAIRSIESNLSTMRYIPSLQVSYAPTTWFDNRLIIGADLSRGAGTQFFPKNNFGYYAGDVNTGNLSENRINFDTYTFDYLGTVRSQVREAIRSSLSFGAQVIQQRNDRVGASGRGFVTNANRVIGAASQISADQFFSDNRSIGFLAQEELGLWDRLFVQVGARIDQNSSFGTNAKPFFLPKVGASYVVSESPFWAGLSNVIPTLRLRAAYGTTGRSPTPGASLETFQSQPFAIYGGGSSAGVIPLNPGNFDLRPERGTEVEAGFDAGFFGDRVGAELTYYRKTTTDLLLQRPVPPSSGFVQGAASNPFVNIGEVLNEGIEYGVHGFPIRRPGFTWELRAAGSTLRNELVSLGGIEPFGSFNRFVEGRQLGAFVTRNVRSVDVANQKVVVSDTLEYFGDLLPKHEGNVGSTLSFGVVELTGSLEFKTGFKIYNNTAQFRDRVFRNSQAGVAVLGATTLTEEQLRKFGPFVSEKSGASVSYTQVNGAYIEDGDYARLRELALTFRLPQRWTRSFGGRGANLTVGGRNLALWSKYSGPDPEVLAQATRNSGVGTFQREDFLTVPQARRWVVRLNVNF